MSRARFARLALILALLLQACGPAPLAPRAPGAPPPAAAAASEDGPGTVQLAVLWPTRDLPGFRAKAVPAAANAIVISFTDDQGRTPTGTPLVISRPAGDGAAAGEAAVSLGRGIYRVEALAYREAAPPPGTTAIARATAAGVAVRSGRVATVSLALSAMTAPFITTLRPRNGAAGTTIRVQGEHLGAAPRVYFNATVRPDNTVDGLAAADVQAAGDGELTVAVPAGARSGNVVVVADGQPSGSSAPFAVLTGLQIRGADEVPLDGAAGFQAVGLDAEGQQVPDPEVVWASSDTAVALVDPASGRVRSAGRSGRALLRLTDAQGRLVAERAIRVRLTTATFASLDYYRAGSVRGLFAADTAAGHAIFAIGLDGTAMRSLDRAASWSLHAAPPARLVVSETAADPAPGNLYMGVTDGRAFVVPAAGGSWTQVSAGTVGNRYMPICAMTSDNVHLYVGLWDGTVWMTPVAGIGPASTWTQVGSAPIHSLQPVTRLRVASGKLYAALAGAYYSFGPNVWQTDLPGGTASTWEPVGPPVGPSITVVYALVDDGTRLYAGVPNHLYATPLAGSGAASSWTEVGAAIGGEQAFWNTAIVRGADLVAAEGASRVYRTAAPGGAGSGTWAALGGGIPGGGIPVVMLADGGDLYAGDTNGLVYRLTGNDAWTLPSGTIIGSTEERVAALGTDGRYLYAVGQGGLSLRSLDGSGPWRRNNLGNLTLRAVASANGAVFAAGDGFSVVRISDESRNWRPFMPTSADIGALAATTALIESNGKLVAGTRSGAVWQTPPSTPDWRPRPAANGPPASVVALAADSDTLAAATGAAVYRAPLADAGAPWTALAGYPGGAAEIRCLAVADGTVYAGAGNGTVYRAGPDGAWSVAGGGSVAGGAAITSLATDGVMLFAGTAGKGIHRLDLAAGGWAPFGGPTLASADVTALLVRGNHLYAAANGQGVYWSL